LILLRLQLILTTFCWLSSKRQIPRKHLAEEQPEVQVAAARRAVLILAPVEPQVELLSTVMKVAVEEPEAAAVSVAEEGVALLLA
jgi:hypothetical protein